MTAVTVVAAHVAVPGGRWRSIDHARRYRPFSTSRSLVHSTGTYAVIGFRDSCWVFFGHKTSYAKLRRELVVTMTGVNQVGEAQAREETS